MAINYKSYYRSSSPFQLINTRVPIVGSLSDVVKLELGETFRYTIYGVKPISTVDNITWNMQVIRNGIFLHNIIIPNTRLGVNQFCWTIDIINTSTVQTSVASLINSTTPVWNGGEKTYYRFDLAGKTTGTTDQFQLKIAAGTPSGLSLYIINVIQEVIKL